MRSVIEAALSSIGTGSAMQDYEIKDKVPVDRDLKLQRVPTQATGQEENVAVHREMTNRGFKIAVGGTIGTGLFVGSGQALAIGGPLFLVISYCLNAFLVYGIASATGEMSSYLPVPGCSVPYYAHRFVSPALGFTMGWVYWYTFAITVEAEITACVLVLEYWDVPGHVAIWITISILVILALNSLPVKCYGEAEFWFASLKVFTILGLFVLTIVLFFGGGPNHKPLYFHNWSTPINEYVLQGTAGRLCAFLGTLPYSFYSFAFAPELLVVTGGEMQSPRQNLSKATKRYFYRLIVFYVLGSVFISIIANSKDSSLSGGSDAGASPWVAGIKAADL